MHSLRLLTHTKVGLTRCYPFVFPLCFLFSLRTRLSVPHPVVYSPVSRFCLFCRSPFVLPLLPPPLLVSLALGLSSSSMTPFLPYSKFFCYLVSLATYEVADYTYAIKTSAAAAIRYCFFTFFCNLASFFQFFCFYFFYVL